MWKCGTCGEQHNDKFQACWKCAGAELASEAAAAAPPEPPPIRRPLCLRCSTTLKYAGAKKLEGRPTNPFDLAGSVFFWGESFDVYVCPKCGHVEFFMQGIGDSEP